FYRQGTQSRPVDLRVRLAHALLDREDGYLRMVEETELLEPPAHLSGAGEGVGNEADFQAAAADRLQDFVAAGWGLPSLDVGLAEEVVQGGRELSRARVGPDERMDDIRNGGFEQVAARV